MVLVVGMGLLWWRWLWVLVEFGVHRSDLGGLDQILTLLRHTLDSSSIPHPRTQLLAHLTLCVSKFLAYQGFWVPGSPTIAELLCFLLAMMPWYTVYDPWIIETAVIKYIKEVWHFAKKSILVVVDPQGKVASQNALHMVRIWGNHAFPFTSDKEDALWKLENWKLDLLVYGIDVEIPDWVSTYLLIYTNNTCGDGFFLLKMAKGRVVCLYGGEDTNWIWKFTTTTKAVAKATGINLELVYVGKNKDGQYYLED